MDTVKDEASGTARGSAPAEPPEAPSQSSLADSPSATADPRTTIAGRYSVELQSEPTQTGIAVAYRGRDLRTRDPVLVKSLRLEYRGDPDMRARFRREARLLQFLSHPNVIRALTFAEERGAPWLVLEHVPGRTLREEIAISAPFSPEEVMPILAGLATALDHLHARGLVHLDLRPENVIVTPRGEPKLIDFGIAQTAGTAQAVADGGIPGSAAYLAPEQTCGDPVTTAADVFALGCVVYELLTGEPPFPGTDAPPGRNAAIRARLEQAPVPPTTARGGDALPGWVDDVVLGALERDPRQRYSSAGSFAAVFHAGVEGDVDVETGRPRATRPAGKPLQIPVNEPGIAVKGAARLAARRAEANTNSGAEVVEADYAPVLPVKPVTYRRAEPGTIFGFNVERLLRRLWQAVLIAVALNLLFMGALVATRGGLPGLGGGRTIGPGTTVRVAGTGLVARDAPRLDAPIVANLPDGGTLRITGDEVTDESGEWWPVSVDTATGEVHGYVPESWVRAP